LPSQGLILIDHKGVFLYVEHGTFDGANCVDYNYTISYAGFTTLKGGIKWSLKPILRTNLMV